MWHVFAPNLTIFTMSRKSQRIFASKQNLCTFAISFAWFNLFSLHYDFFLDFNNCKSTQLYLLWFYNFVSLPSKRNFAGHYPKSRYKTRPQVPLLGMGSNFFKRAHLKSNIKFIRVVDGDDSFVRGLVLVVKICTIHELLITLR